MDSINQMPQTTVKYRDRYVRIAATIIGAHVFTVYGEPESSLEWLFKKDYYPAFAVSLVIAFSITSYIHWITVRLDRKLQWVYSSIERPLLQLLLGVCVPALMAFFMTGIYLRLRGVDILKTSYITHDFQFLLMMLLLINAAYVGYHFYLRWRLAEQALGQARILHSGQTDGHFMVSQGARQIPVQTDTICYFYRLDEVNYLYTTTGERYFIAATLDTVIQQLDRQFFRINRQLIIHRSAMASYRNIENGKIEVILEPALKEPAIVSQKTAKAFREWAKK